MENNALWGTFVKRRTAADDGSNNRERDKMSLKIHKRYFLVREAHGELAEAIFKILEKHKLTYLELVRILLEEASVWTTQGLRHERHPEDPDRKADEE